MIRVITDPDPGNPKERTVIVLVEFLVIKNCDKILFFRNIIKKVKMLKT